MDIDLAGMGSLLRVRDGIYADDLVLAAIVRLDLLTVLDREVVTLETLCRRSGIAFRSADVLCTLLRAMGLLEPGPVLRPSPLARSCLVRGAPFDLRPYLASAASRPTCLEQVELLRTGLPARWTGGRASVWPHDPTFGEHFGGIKAPRARALAPALAEVLDTLPATAVLEVGGCGTTVAALRERRPELAAGVSQSPEMFTALPSGYDVHVLPDTLHRWSERRAREIVGRCYGALAPGGHVVVVDSHLNADKTGPLSVARYSALVLYATEGQCWSVGEVADFLAGAGFRGVQERPAGLDRTAVVGRKPSKPRPSPPRLSP
ncbi:methyltransferase [Phytoactinopolyspora limicola]|uniref:methyltransferase n=1 Tax=Phytoactinopolyspora limicola TaxID=2715536 RepID=UPI00140D3280|nr:methyltransferase [Phytoactinopolyspora limicola]